MKSITKNEAQNRLNNICRYVNMLEEDDNDFNTDVAEIYSNAYYKLLYLVETLINQIRDEKSN